VEIKNKTLNEILLSSFNSGKQKKKKLFSAFRHLLSGLQVYFSSFHGKLRQEARSFSERGMPSTYLSFLFENILTHSHHGIFFQHRYNNSLHVTCCMFSKYQHQASENNSLSYYPYATQVIYTFIYRLYLLVLQRNRTR